jgi:hypothetical protein
MATSIQGIGGRREAFNDLDLLVITGLVIELWKTKLQDRRLDTVCHEWERARAEYAPGVIDLKLGSIASDTDKRKAMLEMLSLVKAHLLGQGETIAAAVLNNQLRVPGVRFSNYKTSVLLTSACRLATLLGREEEDEIKP